MPGSRGASARRDPRRHAARRARVDPRRRVVAVPVGSPARLASRARGGVARRDGSHRVRCVHRAHAGRPRRLRRRSGRGIPRVALPRARGRLGGVLPDRGRAGVRRPRHPARSCGRFRAARRGVPRLGPGGRGRPRVGGRRGRRGVPEGDGPGGRGPEPAADGRGRRRLTRRGAAPRRGPRVRGRGLEPRRGRAPHREGVRPPRGGRRPVDARWRLCTRRPGARGYAGASRSQAAPACRVPPRSPRTRTTALRCRRPSSRSRCPRVRRWTTPHASASPGPASGRRGTRSWGPDVRRRLSPPRASGRRARRRRPARRARARRAHGRAPDARRGPRGSRRRGRRAGRSGPRSRAFRTRRRSRP